MSEEEWPDARALDGATCNIWNQERASQCGARATHVAHVPLPLGLGATVCAEHAVACVVEGVKLSRIVEETA